MMNSKNIKTAILCLTLPLYTFAQSGPFTINGKINPSHDGETVSVVYSKDAKNIQDSAIVKNGTFTINGEIEVPAVAYIRIGKVQPANVTNFYVTKGNTTITTADSLKFATISGNKIADDYSRLSAVLNPLYVQKIAYIIKYQAIPATEKKDAAATAIVSKLEVLSGQINSNIYSFIDKNPDSYISLDYLEKITGSVVNYTETLPRFNKLSDELKNSAKGKAFKEKILKSKSMSVGAKALSFESLTPERKKLGLQEVLSTGKYTLIDFWASWCGPCRKENPNVVNAYTAYHEKGFNILSVSLDNNEGNWKAAIAKDGMPWYHVSGLMGWKEPVALLYGINAIPQNVLVDAKGTIVATNLRGEALLTKLNQLLAK